MPLFNPPAAAGGGTPTLAYVTGNLASDFNLDVDTNYHDVTGVSVSITAGTWLITCTVAASLTNAAGAASNVFAKVLAGATAISSTLFPHDGTGSRDMQGHGPMIAIRVASGSETVKLQARTNSETDGNSIVAIADSLGGVAFATRIIAIQIA